LRESVEQDVAQLNGDQRLGAAFDALCGAVMSGAGAVFLLEGFGGTGTTFLINLVLAKARPEGGIALPIASSGIATTLLDGGTTAHSRLKIPIDIPADSTCNIRPAQSHLAELLRQTQLVFRDEAPLQHRYTFEAVNRTLKDIRNGHWEGLCFVSVKIPSNPSCCSKGHTRTDCISMHQAFSPLGRRPASFSHRQDASLFTNHVSQ